MHAKVPEFATIYSRPHSEKISPPMRALLQRVLEAKVMVDGEITGEIQQGILVFLGLSKALTRLSIKALFCWIKYALMQEVPRNDDPYEPHYSISARYWFI